MIILTQLYKNLPSLSVNTVLISPTQKFSSDKIRNLKIRFVNITGVLEKISAE
jgi:hypothetical protein